MKIVNYCLIATAVLSTSASAAFVNFGTGGARGHEFLVSTGGARVAVSPVITTPMTPPLDTHNRLVVGYLTTPGVASSFVEFARTTINNPLSTATVGGFVNVPTLNNGSAAALAAMKNVANQVAIWVYGQGGAQGLFTSASWTAPASVTTEVDSSWDLNLGVGQGLPTVVVTPINIPGVGLGTYTIKNITVTTGSNTNGASYGLVPEPSVSLMGLLGVIGLLARRRR